LELALRILLAVVVLAGLITTIMSVKNWHWAQMLLVLGIFLSSLGALILGLEVFRIHRNIRSRIPELELQLAAIEEQNEALEYGADAAMASKVFPEGVPFEVEAEGSMPSLSAWTRRLQDLGRQRGRVWRGVAPAGRVDPATNRVSVTIAQPQPHGLEQDAIVYAFEWRPPNAAPAQDIGQYLGEFRVVEVRPDGATLESVNRLDSRTGNRLAASQGPWALYETMPADSHEQFARFSDDELRQLLPAASVEEYVRHGAEATNDDDEFHRAGFDEQEHRLGPDDAADVVEWRYDRPLRDYAYLFSAASRALVELVAEQDALAADIKKLAAANDVAQQLGALRTEERDALQTDLTHLENDRQAITALLADVHRTLAHVKKVVVDLQAENLERARELSERQQQELERLDELTPAGDPLANVAP
jgi:hypothetical protein